MRVTFLTPHQRTGSGGVYTILQFARHLADTVEVRLAVAKGETAALPGVTVIGPEPLREGEVPDGDLLVVPADFRPRELAFGLPRPAGRRIALFQGYGTPGNPQVAEILPGCDHALVVAGWLLDEARRFGTDATLVRHGLDRSVFFPGVRSPGTAPTVGMMTSDLDWKGTVDGLAALEQARATVPNLRVRLFGRTDPRVEWASYLPPSGGRPQIAELMRGCDVFVCASWEEGFGLPGLEALACGAALATTDTRGSRDYAFDGRTALVSQPRDVRALAENVIRLVGDAALRRRQVAAARRHIDATYPDWPQASALLGRALAGLAAP
jgi:glycosyltransferase involved in cell wall biosynthesis